MAGVTTCGTRRGLGNVRGQLAPLTRACGGHGEAAEQQTARNVDVQSAERELRVAVGLQQFETDPDSCLLQPAYSHGDEFLPANWSTISRTQRYASGVNNFDTSMPVSRMCSCAAVSAPSESRCEMNSTSRCSTLSQSGPRRPSTIAK